MFVFIDYSKMTENKDVQFFGELETEKGQKNFDLPQQGFEHQIFRNFIAHDLNFRGR